jgi:hypothetical protein
MAAVVLSALGFVLLEGHLHTIPMAAFWHERA